MDNNIRNQFRLGLMPEYHDGSYGDLIRPKEIARSSFFLDFYLYLFEENIAGRKWLSSNIKLSNDGRHVIETESGNKPSLQLRKKIKLPEEIVEDFKEAFGCYLHGFYKASVIMCRRLLEEILTSRGANPEYLVSDMIKQLVVQGVIDSRLKRIADDIKELGNRGAHVNRKIIDDGDAFNALTFSDFLITWLYGQVYERPLDEP